MRYPDAAPMPVLCGWWEEICEHYVEEVRENYRRALEFTGRSTLTKADLVQLACMPDQQGPPSYRTREPSTQTTKANSTSKCR